MILRKFIFLLIHVLYLWYLYV